MGSIKSIALALMAVTLLASCSNPNESNEGFSKGKESKSTNQDLEEGQKEVDPREIVYYDYSNATFESAFVDSVSNFFSDNRSPDKFKIYVPEGKVTETVSFLLVTDSSGDTLHFEEFDTSELIYGYKLDEMDSDREVINHIKERVAMNLSKSAFINIRTTDMSVIKDSSPEDFVDFETFERCKKEDLPLYCFLLGNENSTFYGFSESEKKAVPILYCC